MVNKLDTAGLLFSNADSLEKDSSTFKTKKKTVGKFDLGPW